VIFAFECTSMCGRAIFALLKGTQIFSSEDAKAHRTESVALRRASVDEAAHQTNERLENPPRKNIGARGDCAGSPQLTRFGLD